MAYEIEDGEGSRSKVSIFENRLRTLATECSLMNHIASEINEHVDALPNVGVYEVRIETSVAGSGGSSIYLRNEDPDNFVNIDRLFTGTVATVATLPDTSTYLSVLMGSVLSSGTGTILSVDNLNQSITNVQPAVTILNGATTSGGAEMLRRYLTIGRVYRQEPMPQKSDGIILGTGNSMEVFIFSLTSATIEVNMRFAMTDPDDLGFEYIGRR